ncbi:hypothetical protein D3C81_1889820 [compost metagenome]
MKDFTNDLTGHKLVSFLVGFFWLCHEYFNAVLSNEVSTQLVKELGLPHLNTRTNVYRLAITDASCPLVNMFPWPSEFTILGHLTGSFV